VTQQETPGEPTERVRIERHITLDAALSVVQVGLRKATEMGMRVGICVTDANGNVVVRVRMDGAHIDTDLGGQRKAVFAARMGRSTADFVEQRLKQDEVLWRAMSNLPEVFLVPGGVPLVVDGVTVGGVGVSGGKYQHDAEVAEAAAAHFHAPR
jgi:uncharacterized protein GlcG (DUF336 family)